VLAKKLGFIQPRLEEEDEPSVKHVRLAIQDWERVVESLMILEKKSFDIEAALMKTVELVKNTEELSRDCLQEMFFED